MLRGSFLLFSDSFRGRKRRRAAAVLFFEDKVTGTCHRTAHRSGSKKGGELRRAKQVPTEYGGASVLFNHTTRELADIEIALQKCPVTSRDLRRLGAEA